MISYQYLLSVFQGTLLQYQLPFNQFSLNYHLIFSDTPNSAPLSSESIVLCTAEAFRQYLEFALPPKVCFCVSDSENVISTLYIPQNCCYIAVRDSYSELCTRFISIYQEYTRYRYLLNLKLTDSRQVRSYLQKLSSETGIAFSLYNQNGELLPMFSSSEPDVPAQSADSLPASSQYKMPKKLPSHLFQRVRQPLKFPDKPGSFYLECQKLGEENFFLYAVTSDEFHCDITWVSRKALSAILHSLSDFHTLLYTEEETKAGEFISDIMNQKSMDLLEDYTRFRSLVHYDSKYTTIFYIRFTNSDTAPSRIFFLDELHKLIPEALIGPWNDDIIAFIPNPDRQSRLDQYEEGLQKLLERYQAYAGSSLWTKWRFRTSILLAESNAKFGQILGLEPSRHLFFSNEYSFYHLIDLAADSFQRIHHSKDLTYLMHPCILHINRYDIEHDTNLLEVLYHYLINGCRVGDTSISLNMHRNTVQGKLNKLNEIIHEDFTKNGIIQCRILISCMVFFYQDRYLKEPFSNPQSMLSSFHQLDIPEYEKE